MKILLVSPVNKNEVMAQVKSSVLPPLNLAIIAALTPDCHEISIVDENKENIESYLNGDYDLVGFTGPTHCAPRVYKLASHFRNREIKTIMGGIHARLMPTEASEYVDSVFIGEAEAGWHQVLEDLERDQLSSYYNVGLSPHWGDFMPRWDLLLSSYKIPHSIETTRGCPMDCDFCSVTALYGRSFRRRPVKQVLDELEKYDGSVVIFRDDNIVGFGEQEEKSAMEIFQGIIDRGIKIRWVSQAPVSIASNERLLKLARRSGAMGLLIGFESVSENTLKEMNKKPNLNAKIRDPIEVAHRIRDNGIAVFGLFIFGNDNDRKDIFKRTIDFVMNVPLDASQYGISTPFPGTQLFQRLMSQSRILKTNFPKDWEFYDGIHPLYEPKELSIDELLEGLRELYDHTHSIGPVLKRMASTFMKTKKTLPSLLCAEINRYTFQGINRLGYI